MDRPHDAPVIMRSQNHRMAWVGRDLKDHESPTPLPGRATNLPIYYTRLPRAPSYLSLNTSRGRAFTVSLGSLF